MRYAPARELKFSVPIVIAAACLFGLALLSAAAIPLMGPVAGLPAAAVFATLLAVIAVTHAGDSRSALLLLGILALQIFLGLLAKATGRSLFGGWQVLLMFVALFGLKDLSALARIDRLFALFVIFTSAFLVWGLISTIGSRARYLAAAYQLMSDLKPFLMVALGFAIGWNVGVSAVLDRVAAWSWLVVALFIVVEWAAPGIYFKVFAAGGVLRGTLDPVGFFPSRATSIFEHPSVLAAYAAFFALYSFTMFGRPGLSRFSWGALTIIYFGIIVAAVQRQELVACMLAAAVIFLFRDKKRVAPRLIVAMLLLVLGGALFWIIFSENILHEAAMWGFGNSHMVEHPRAQIFIGGFNVAMTYWPFGSGLGTYGGAGAEKFDQSLYYYLGFGRYWWFGKQDYLLDTYWPNSLAETGFLGASFLLISYIVLSLACLRRSLWTDGISRRLWLLAGGSTLYVLLISPTSPAFQDPRLFAWSAMMVGMAFNAERKSV